MLFLDVNVLVGAQRNDESMSSRPMREWLDGALAGHEAIGVCELALSAMVRIVTHPKVFEQPSAPGEALEFSRVLLDAPRVAIVRPAARHWTIFADLVREHRLRGNDVPDAYYAAIALEQGATVVTADRGFQRFGVRTLDPTSR
ncbi:MAG: TA system VapC family ribonuclease toxin [Actinomycetaceae bacterium]